MGLFSKKESIPELPTLPSVPEIKIVERKSNELPPLKDVSQSHYNSLDSSVKSDGDIEASIGLAYNESKQIGKIPLPDFPKFDSYPNTNEVKKLEMRESVLPDLPKPEYKLSIEKPIREEMLKKDVNETIFVRIDKFQLAKKELNEVNKLVESAHDTIVKINEIKLQEDEELIAINEDLESLKAKLGEIDEYVFNRL